MKTGALTTIIGGITTQLLAVMIWYVGWHFFQSDVLKLWVNLILPFGALMLGLAAEAEKASARRQEILKIFRYRADASILHLASRALNDLDSTFGNLLAHVDTKGYAH